MRAYESMHAKQLACHCNVLFICSWTENIKNLTVNSVFHILPQVYYRENMKEFLSVYMIKSLCNFMCRIHMYCTCVTVLANLGTSLWRTGQKSENAGTRNKDEQILANERGTWTTSAWDPWKQKWCKFKWIQYKTIYPFWAFSFKGKLNFGCYWQYSMFTSIIYIFWRSFPSYKQIEIYRHDHLSWFQSNTTKN